MFMRFERMHGPKVLRFHSNEKMVLELSGFWGKSKKNSGSQNRLS